MNENDFSAWAKSAKKTIERIISQDWSHEPFEGWQDRWVFDPEWSVDQAHFAQYQWVRARRPDGRARGPLDAWRSARQLKECEEHFKQGKKHAILQGVRLCMLDDLPIPVWLSVAFIGAFDSVSQYRAKGWNDVFGIAHKKGTNLTATKKRKELAPQLFMLAADVLFFHPETVIDADFYEQVGREFNVGKTLAQEYISGYCKTEGTTLQYYRDLSRNITENCGSADA